MQPQRLVVEPSPYLRRWCPVRCELPVPMASPRLFRAGVETPIACQFDPATNELWWMLPRLQPHESVEYEVHDDPRRRPPALARCRETFAGWRFTVRRRPVAEWLVHEVGGPALTLRSANGLMLRVEFPRGTEGCVRRTVAPAELVVGPVYAEACIHGAWEDRWGRRTLSERLTVRCYDGPNWLAIVDVRADFSATTGEVEFASEWRLAPFREMTWTAAHGGIGKNLGDEPAPWISGVGERGAATVMADWGECSRLASWNWDGGNVVTVRFVGDEDRLLRLGRQRSVALRWAISDRPESAGQVHWYTDYRWPAVARVR